MFKKNCVIIKKNNKFKIILLNYPNEVDLQLSQPDQSTQNVKKKLNDFIDNSVILLNTNLNIEELLEQELEDLENSEYQEENIKIFSKMLPFIGDIFNILGILSNGFITFMSFKIINNDNKNESFYFSISAAFLNAIFSLIIYYASDASKSLSALGNKLDKLSIKNNIPFSNFNYKTCKLTFFHTTILFLALINVIISAIVQYKQLTLLSEQYLDSYNELDKNHKELYLNLIKWLIIDISNILATGYCSLAFQYSFIISFIKKVFGSNLHLSNLSEPSMIVDYSSSTSEEHHEVLFDYNRNVSNFNQNNEPRDTEDLLYDCFKKQCKIS